MSSTLSVGLIFLFVVGLTIADPSWLKFIAALGTAVSFGFCVGMDVADRTPQPPRPRWRRR